MNGRAIIDACVALKLPAIHAYVFEARNGALMSYGYDPLVSYRLTAEYVDRILKGAKIADLPFQQATRLALAITGITLFAFGTRPWLCAICASRVPTSASAPVGLSPW